MQTDTGSILDEIVENKVREVELRKEEVPFETFAVNMGKSCRDFKGAIKRKDEGSVNLIAELKFASPSRGKIRDASVDEIERIARLYDEYAGAISVLTDEKYFSGSVEYLGRVSRVSSVPILCKDFIVDRYQILEARYHGADAVLLIVSVLGALKLSDFIGVARKFGMDCLVEVHDEDEICIALEAGADIIGINNRDLRTMKVDISNTIRLLDAVPDDIVVVSESGIVTHKDVVKLKETRVDAMLVGTVIMIDDVEVKLRELTGV